MQVGSIGLGIRAAGMAANLQKAGFELVVHDIREASATPHLSAGAKWANSPKSLAAQSKVIFTSLPGPAEVEVVALGSNGCSRGWRRAAPGLISPPTHRRWAAGSPTVQRRGLAPA